MTRNVQAVVVNRQDWGENDALLTFYTRELGKVEAVARGLRKLTSKLAGHLELFTGAEVFLVEGRRRTIVAGSVVECSRSGLRADLSRLQLAATAARLVDLMTPLESPEEGIFDLFGGVLGSFEAPALTRTQGELLLHFFAWKLLVFSGYRPELKACLRCRRSAVAAPVALDARRGGVVHLTCWPAERGRPTGVSVTTLKGLVYMAGAPLADALRLRASRNEFAEIGAVVQALVEERYEQAFPAAS